MPWRYFEKANAYGFIWPRWVFVIIILFLVFLSSIICLPRLGYLVRTCFQK